MLSVYEQVVDHCRKSPYIPQHIIDIINTPPSSYKPIELECPICFEMITAENLTISECNHIYCVNCYENAMNVKPVCSVCRTDLNHTRLTSDEYIQFYKPIKESIKTIEKMEIRKEKQIKLTQLFRYIRSTPIIFEKCTRFRKSLLMKVPEIKDSAYNLGDIELISACIDLYRSLRYLPN
jgi:hypothetical protein